MRSARSGDQVSLSAVKGVVYINILEEYTDNRVFCQQVEPLPRHTSAPLIFLKQK